MIEETEEAQEAQEAEEDTDGEQFVEDSQENTQEEMNGDIQEIAGNFDVAGIPAYSGEPYVAVNGNVLYFADSELCPTRGGYKLCRWKQ